MLVCMYVKYIASTRQLVLNLELVVVVSSFLFEVLAVLHAVLQTIEEEEGWHCY